MGTAGTFAVISILVGNICLQLAPESKFWVFDNATNKSYVDTAAMEAERLHVSATLACLTAIIQVRGLPRPCRGLSLGRASFPSCPCLQSPVFDTEADSRLYLLPLPHSWGHKRPPEIGVSPHCLPQVPETSICPW